MSESPTVEEPKEVEARKSSYGSILKSSSILGGSQALTYGMGLLRTKAAALLLGVNGIAMIGLFNSVIGFSATLSAMGLRNSAVREIAQARASGDGTTLFELQVSVRRLAVLLGCIGALTLAILAPIFSRLVFGDNEYSVGIALLGGVLVLNGLHVTHSSILQGSRRIKNLAQVSILGAILGGICAVLLYAIFGQAGIVPALITIAMINACVSGWFVRVTWGQGASVAWRTSKKYWKGLLAVGSAVAWGEMLAQLVPLFAKSLIARELGFEQAGLYIAAWAISGMLASFILRAISADYYPRLCAVSQDPEKMNLLANEQIEVGVLLVLPALLFAVAFATPIFDLLYSKDFGGAAILLPWLLFGTMGRIVNFPMDMIVLALGKSQAFAFVQSVSVIMHIAWVVFLFWIGGLVGVAIAFAVHNWVRNFIFLRYYRRYGFERSNVLNKIIIFSTLLLAVAMMLNDRMSGSGLYYTLAACLVIGGGIFSLRELLLRVDGHPLVEKIKLKVPGWIMGLILK